MRILAFHLRLTHIQVNIPVIIVFTKYDGLIKEQEYTNAEEYGGKLSKTDIWKRAEMCFNDRIKEFKVKRASIVKVSTHKDYPRSSSSFSPHQPETSSIAHADRLQTLRELSDATRKCLGKLKKAHWYHGLPSE